jgi:hypothetical protein
MNRHAGPISIGRLLHPSGAPRLDEIRKRIDAGEVHLVPHRPRAGGKRLRLLLGRDLARWRQHAGAGVFELLARILAGTKAAPGLAGRLGGDANALPIVALDRANSLVTVSGDGGLIGVDRSGLGVGGLSARACLVATVLAHGLRAASRVRAGEEYDAGKERKRDIQNLLILLVGVLGTEWDPEEVEGELRDLLGAKDPLLAEFGGYARKLLRSIARRTVTRLDDRVFRDGALFDHLPRREKIRVVMAGTMAWYGMLTLGLLRLPRRLFARINPYYETAWWIFRAKPGGRGLFKSSLLRRARDRFASFRILAGMEYLWSSWNPTLAETCLRPVYRMAGGNRRPFLATIATYTYTAFVIHPMWFTLAITGAAFALGPVWPWLDENTRIASRENLILHAIVIGFWLGVGLIVATSKALRRRP